MIAELVQVRGIGRWTAEMFLMFNLLRPDVLPLDDLGLQRAASRALLRRRGRRRGRAARVRRPLGALALGGDLVPVALARSGPGRILSSPLV